MKTNPDDPAFPNKDELGDGPEGLTKREYFAARVMQAILSQDTMGQAQLYKSAIEQKVSVDEFVSIISLGFTDALIAELNK